MAAREYQEEVSKLRELMIKNDTKNERNRTVPFGAEKTFWAFAIPSPPKNQYDVVYPGIYLGNQSLAHDKPALCHHGITHVLNAAQGGKFNQIATDEDYYADVGLTFLGIPAIDTPFFKLAPYFQPAADFIERALAENGKVFVHCQQGMSRSATLVLAYLMLKHGLSLTDAVTTVIAKREIFPNDGFLRQLCQLDKDLREAR